ncbi:unnamed protein product [Staurois parvus]|uniref:Uncharacterized protein n=1 Tax=Staurois parvus TaxID=386267 RepID=A0ABN9GUT3_9NEOB|nr:unnamed protein product [Staurois parvus]
MEKKYYGFSYILSSRPTAYSVQSRIIVNIPVQAGVALHEPHSLPVRCVRTQIAVRNLCERSQFM